MTPSEIHNQVSAAALRAIVKPIVDSGGTSTDILVALESVVIGVFLAVVRLGGDEPVIEVFAEGVRQRLAEIRLGGLAPEGEA